MFSEGMTPRILVEVSGQICALLAVRTEGPHSQCGLFEKGKFSFPIGKVNESVLRNWNRTIITLG